MPKVTSAPAGRDNLKFRYDISVDRDGEFTTTLPKDVVEKLQAANVDLKPNRLNNYGFFIDKTLEGLKKKVDHVVDDYFSRKLTSRKIIIKYVIQTTCSYCLDIHGNVVPNGADEWTKKGYSPSAGCAWKEGTVSHDATHRHPFGISVYAKPFVREDYVYKSGTKKTEYINMCYGGAFADNAIERGYSLKWLSDIPAQDVPQESRESDVKEMDYTENVAKFFVNLIMSICKLNEQIKDKLDPKSILKLIAQKQHLLGRPE